MSGQLERNVLVIEIDGFNGEETVISNYGGGPPWTWTKDEAERTIAWREKHITNRYTYCMRAMKSEGEIS